MSCIEFFRGARNMGLIPFDDRDGSIWMNGQIVPWRDAKAHTLSHGLHYASLVFCLLYTSPSPRDYAASRMPSSA